MELKNLPSCFFFHSQDKNVRDNKKAILKRLQIHIKELKHRKIYEFKNEIYNKKKLNEIIDKVITEDNYKNKEKCRNKVKEEINNLIETFMTNIFHSLEEVFYENILSYVIRELPSDEDTVKSEVERMRKEIKEFLQKEKVHYSIFYYLGIFSSIIKYTCVELLLLHGVLFLGKRIYDNLFQLTAIKTEVFNTYSTDYWMNGKEIIQFFEDFLKKVPDFVDRLDEQYQKKTYSGNSNDLYSQAEHLLELINKSY